MRDKLIHHYFGVKLDIVWDTVTQVLPEFRPFVASILSESANSQEEQP